MSQFTMQADGQHLVFSLTLKWTLIIFFVPSILFVQVFVGEKIAEKLGYFMMSWLISAMIMTALGFFIIFITNSICHMFFRNPSHNENLFKLCFFICTILVTLLIPLLVSVVVGDYTPVSLFEEVLRWGYVVPALIVMMRVGYVYADRYILGDDFKIPKNENKPV